MFTTTINSLAIFLSLSTATGILVHDTKVDKATVTALNAPQLESKADMGAKSTSLTPEVHAHVKKISVARSLLETRTLDNPRTQARISEDKKYQLPKNVVRGHHAFDNYNLPIV